MGPVFSQDFLTRVGCETRLEATDNVADVGFYDLRRVIFAKGSMTLGYTPGSNHSSVWTLGGKAVRVYISQ